MAAGHEPTLQDLSREFHLTPELIWTIDPDHNSRGGITEFNPWERFPNKNGLMLHAWGEGPFCRFRIPGRFRNCSGIYILVTGGKVTFVGWCQNLVQRMNQHYGTISPRKCYERSEPENCLVNHRILEVAQSKRKVQLYLIQDGASDLCEMIISRLNPSWNSDLE
ncbi:MAG: hypothetical protein LUQ50_00440 [Methanospirillum sp.]|uniref:hypothetical protein n=1 Tax=Methanospirillum sp. TaxID=45200 RepID=UPI0023698CBB|nr:hypothetical protein [Methanospirillum sp.]MDD1727519.1 hypothetical protein [Methanospirillum sp.]